MELRRPTPLWWLWYTYGGRLPERYWGWVYFDTTSRRWLLRYLVRLLVQGLPFAVAGFLLLLFLTPVPWWADIVIMGFGILLGLFYTVGAAPEFNEVRLRKHGFPPGSGPQWR